MSNIIPLKIIFFIKYNIIIQFKYNMQYNDLYIIYHKIYILINLSGLNILYFI